MKLRDADTTIPIVDQIAALAFTVSEQGYALEQSRVVTKNSVADVPSTRG